MVTENYNTQDIQRIVERERTEFHDTRSFFIEESANKTTYARLMVTSADRQTTRTASLILVPDRRLQYFVRTDGRLAFTTHFFERYAERVKGVTRNDIVKELGGGPSMVSVACMAATYFMCEQQFINPIGTITYPNPSGKDQQQLMMYSKDGLIICSVMKHNGIPVANTFIDIDSLKPGQKRGIDLFIEGKTAESLSTFEEFYRSDYYQEQLKSRYFNK